MLPQCTWHHLHFCTCSLCYLGVLHLTSTTVHAQCVNSVYFTSPALLYTLSVLHQYTSPHQHLFTCSVCYLHIPHLTSTTVHTRSVCYLSILHLTSTSLHAQCVTSVYFTSPAPLYMLSVLSPYTSSHQHYYTYSVGRQEAIRVVLKIRHVMMIHNQMPKC